MGPNKSGCGERAAEAAAGEVLVMAGTLASDRRSADYLERNCCDGAAMRLLARPGKPPGQPKEDVMNASTDRLLRRTLWGNAIFSVISGAVLAIFAGPFAEVAAHAPVSL